MQCIVFIVVESRTLHVGIRWLWSWKFVPLLCPVAALQACVVERVAIKPCMPTTRNSINHVRRLLDLPAYMPVVLKLLQPRTECQ